ncbi:MAG: peptidoglycan-binding domain-containing protein, partial [Candidatus Paceibacterota bacterium]
MRKFSIKFYLTFLCSSLVLCPGLGGVWAAAALGLGSHGAEVKLSQITLNLDLATRVAATGDGSPGKETDYFGNKTRLAVLKFQKKYGIKGETGRIGPQTSTLMAYLRSKLITEPKFGSKIKKSVTSAIGPVASSVTLKLASLQPTIVGNGGRVTIYGEGFTKTGNDIETKYKT